MKNLVLTMGVVLFLCGAAGAQETAGGITGQGFKLGIGIANISTDYEELNEFLDSRVGFSGGVFLTYAIDRQFSIQPEILYVSKGAAKDFFFFDAHWNLDYLEIPVLLKLDLAPEDKVHPSLFAGPALDILMASKFHVLNEEYDIKDFTKSMDVSLIFGAGLDYKRVTFDIRYSLGLSGVVDVGQGINEATGAEEGDAYYLDGTPSVKNTDIQFMAGVRF